MSYAGVFYVIRKYTHTHFSQPTDIISSFVTTMDFENNARGVDEKRQKRCRIVCDGYRRIPDELRKLYDFEGPEVQDFSGITKECHIRFRNYRWVYDFIIQSWVWRILKTAISMNSLTSIKTSYCPFFQLRRCVRKKWIWYRDYHWNFLGKLARQIRSFDLASQWC